MSIQARHTHTQLTLYNYTCTLQSSVVQRIWSWFLNYCNLIVNYKKVPLISTSSGPADGGLNGKLVFKQRLGQVSSQ